MNITIGYSGCWLSRAPLSPDVITKWKMVHRFTKRLLLLLCLIYTGELLANNVENKFRSAGLVDVAKIDSSIEVDLVNSDADKNFFHKDFYEGMNKAYLRKRVAKKLSKAQRLLKK
ncbi:MAG: hypothetical protein ABW138_08330, partial [Candidatus Thiodiazotropha sp. 4PDIVS1]